MADDAISGALCAVNGCDSKILSRGWCSIHYTRWRKHGDPLAVHVKAKEKAATRAARLLAKPPVQKQQPRTCYQCEEVFYRTGGNGPNSRDAGTCCSRECGWKWQGRKKSAAMRVVFVVKRKRCRHCDKPFTDTSGRAVWCSPTCRETSYAEDRVANHKARPFVCAECGREHTPAYGDTSSKFCSKGCLKRFSRKVSIANGSRAASRKARKLRLRGITVESVNPLMVLERDKWTCQICGVQHAANATWQRDQIPRVR